MLFFRLPPCPSSPTSATVFITFICFLLLFNPWSLSRYGFSSLCCRLILLLFSSYKPPLLPQPERLAAARTARARSGRFGGRLRQPWTIALARLSARCPTPCIQSLCLGLRQGRHPAPPRRTGKRHRLADSQPHTTQVRGGGGEQFDCSSLAGHGRVGDQDKGLDAITRQENDLGAALTWRTAGKAAVTLNTGMAMLQSVVAKRRKEIP